MSCRACVCRARSSFFAPVAPLFFRGDESGLSECVSGGLFFLCLVVMIRFLFVGGFLFVSSTAFAQPALQSQASADLDAALRESDRDAALALPADPLTASQSCVVAMLRDQALREVHLPREIRVSDFDRALLESARDELRLRLPALIRQLQMCLGAIDAAPAFRDDREPIRQRLEDLQTLAFVLEPPLSFAAFPTMHLHLHGAEWDVSWRAVRTRYRPPVAPGEEGWRVTPMVASLVFVALPAVYLPFSLVQDDLNSPDARLIAIGVGLGSLGGSFISRIWHDPESPKTRTRLVLGALWSLASIAGGIALLSSNAPRRFRRMGAGFLTGGVVDTALWAGAMRLSRQARSTPGPQVSVTQHGGVLRWSARF